MPDSAESIAAEEFAANILETFHRERVPMAVVIADSDTNFNSSLLKLRADHLFIDQLVPRVGDQLLQPGMSLVLKASYKGVAFWFQSRHLEQAVDERGHSYHLVTRPALVESEDKRSQYRVSALLSDNFDCRVAMPGTIPGKGRLEDLSEGGACIRLSGGRSGLQVGDLVGFSLSSRQLGSLDCQASVRYLQQVATSGETRLGVSFTRLATNQKSALRRILMKLQRRHIRTCLPR